MTYEEMLLAGLTEEQAQQLYDLPPEFIIDAAKKLKRYLLIRRLVNAWSK